MLNESAKELKCLLQLSIYNSPGGADRPARQPTPLFGDPAPHVKLAEDILSLRVLYIYIYIYIHVYIYIYRERER